MIFQEKRFSYYILLNDQILLPDSFTSRDIGELCITIVNQAVKP